MDGIRLVQQPDGSWEWHCEHCGMDNVDTGSFLGLVACDHCHKTSFVVEVIR